MVARAPGRVNLIGEHTDYNDGFVLPMALEQSTWAAAAPREDAIVCVRSAQEGFQAQTWPLGGWQRERQPKWTAYVAGVVELLRERGARLPGFDLLIASDVPVGGGLSSSAALEVSTGLALAHLAGEPLSTAELADLARAAEHQYANMPCGIMDQYISVLGEAGSALLLDCRSRSYEHIPLKLDGHRILVVNSGVKHDLGASEYPKRQQQCQAAVRYFQRVNRDVRALRDVSSETVRAHASQMDPLAFARALHVTTEDERTVAAAAALRSGNLPELGRLLLASHNSLRDSYEVSCRELDLLVELVSAVPGVVGARMTGGGFGGCIVAIAVPSAIPAVQAVLRDKYDQKGRDGQDGRHATLLETRAGVGARIELG